MAGIDDPVVLLRGGSRDGQLTSVTPEVTRLLAPGNAPGLLDVYELVDETVRHPDAEGEVPVFEFSGQEPADVAPELQHMPGSNPVPGDT